MIVQHRFNLISVLRLLPLVACILVLVTSCLALVVWALDIGVLKGLIQGQRGQLGPYGMTPNAAVCFILCGAALLLVRAPMEKDLDVQGLDGGEWTLGAEGFVATLSVRRLARLIALAAMTLALLTFVGYVFGWNLGIERALLWRQPAANGGAFLNQMAPNTTLCFLLSGTSLLLLDVELRHGGKPAPHTSHYPSQYLALVTLLISLTALLGHVYGIPSVYGPAGMAPYTAISFVALSAGLVCARPEQGLMAMVTSGSAGGFMARRMLIWAIIGPVLLGCLILLGVRAGFYDTAYGVPLLVAAIIVISLVVVWRNAMQLHQIETERVLAEAALCQAYANTEKQVSEQASELVRANQDMWAMMREREQAEDELRRNREELADFFENAPVGAHWIDPDGTILWANKAELDLLGYLPEEYIGHHVSKFYADKSVSKNILNRLRRGANLDNHEVRLRAKDGSIRYGLINSNGVWQDGQLVHTRGFVRDITERKRAEARLRESEERFRRMANAAPVMIWMSGPDKLCHFFNQGWLDFTGRQMEQEMGAGWAEGIHPEDFDYCLETYITAFDAREEFRLEYRLRRHDGEYRWILGQGVPRFDFDGKFAGYIAAGIDIDERKEAEELLRASEEFNHRVLESSHDCINTLTLDGRLISMNAPGMNALEIGDLTPYLDQPWINFWQGEARAAAHEAIKAAAAGGIGRFTAFSKTVKKTPKWWESVISPTLDVRGKPERLVVISRDITEQKRFEEEHRQLLAREQSAREQAENANRLKDEFLATVSHELRAPLNAIQGWVKLLREGKLQPDEATRALETIERSARAQNRIISDLLDVSRIITGKLRLNIRSVNPALVVEAAVETVRPAAEAKSIRLEMMLDDGAGPVSGDSDRLQQIVWNLLSNAIKFTPKHGRVQVRLERANSGIEIIVSDTGVGIKPEFLPYVFDRFRQADGSTTRSQGGLGLGLAIVRHLVEMHGGSVRAESSGVGEGSTFIISLPLMIVHGGAIDTARLHPAAAGGEASIDCPPRLDDLRVLVVDDDADARELVRTILCQSGALVKTAGTADEALAILSARRRRDAWQPDLLISDIEMPEADGYMLIRKLRVIEAQRGGKIPAVALTAYTRVEDRLRSLSAGFHMHLGKPVEAMELLTVVASLTGRLGRQKSPREDNSEALPQEALK
jgi:PAS domain S-box-containing protein